jgi:tRNA (guanine37-N1)-methyltransferase
VNIRDYANNKHKKVDDYPYGGGAGMVMQPQPIISAYEATRKKCNRTPRVIYVTPQGKTFDQKMAEHFAQEEELIFLCGHYEGVDERVIEKIVTDEVSIGDYVLTGGELAVMVMVDAITRLKEGVLNNDESIVNESFNNGLLEHPQYTRPYEFEGMTVPDVLVSGHHENISRWRREKSLLKTAQNRPDLLKTANLTKEDKIYLKKHCNISEFML